MKYHSLHQKLTRRFGHARWHLCAGCESQAQQWAYDGKDPNQIWSKHGFYSLDLSRYRPLCIPCHARDRQPN